MSLRRFALALLAVAVCGALLTLAFEVAPCVRSRLLDLSGIERLARLHLLGPGVARASKLEFRRVPPESAEAPARAAEREAPKPPAPPEPPGEPQAPRIIKTGDVMRVGTDIHIERDEVVRGSVSAIGGDVTVDGTVEGDVTAMRGDVTLGPTARVDGDVVSLGGQLHESPGAYVGGQRVTAMPGRRLRHLRSPQAREEVEHATGTAAGLVVLLILLGISWAIAQLAPGRTGAAVETLRRAPLLSFGIGSLILALIIPSLIALSLVVAFLCITIIGIPLALAALLGYALFFAVFAVWGYVVGAGAIGEAIVERRSVTAAGLAPQAAPMPAGSVALPAPAGAAVLPAPGAGTAARSMTPVVRAVLVGTLALGGSLFVGSVLGAPYMLGPFRVLGGFMFVIGIVVSGLATLAGGGAWLRSEFATGTLGRWWQRRKAQPAPAAAASAPPPAPASEPPPPPPSPPQAFMPPAEGNPPSTA